MNNELSEEREHKKQTTKLPKNKGKWEFCGKIGQKIEEWMTESTKARLKRP